MKLRDRIGVDLGRKIRLEDGIEWAAKNGVRFIDVQLDTAENALTTFDAKRCTAVRKQLDKRRIKLGLHTNSAVNVAEYSPYVADAVTEYLKSHVDIQSPAFKLSFTANHAHLVPEGIEGFVKVLDFKRVGEVRLADTYRNGHEIHLKPGTGNLDFGQMFKLIEGKGYRGHYTNAFGSLGDMLAGRDYLVDRAREAGVRIN